VSLTALYVRIFFPRFRDSDPPFPCVFLFVAFSSLVFCFNAFPTLLSQCCLYDFVPPFISCMRVLAVLPARPSLPPLPPVPPSFHRYLTISFFLLSLLPFNASLALPSLPSLPPLPSFFSSFRCQQLMRLANITHPPSFPSSLPSFPSPSSSGLSATPTATRIEALGGRSASAPARPRPPLLSLLLPPPRWTARPSRR